MLYVPELMRALRSCDPAEKDLEVSGAGDGRKEVQGKAFRGGNLVIFSLPAVRSNSGL